MRAVLQARVKPCGDRFDGLRDDLFLTTAIKCAVAVGWLGLCLNLPGATFAGTTWYVDVAARPAVVRGYHMPMYVNDVPMPA